MTASRRAVLGAAFAALTAAGCDRGADPATAGRGSAPLEVGVRSSGGAFAAGFGAGLSYATNRSNRIGDRHITVSWLPDVASAEDFVARGGRILVGGNDSAEALRLAGLAESRRVLFISGPATDDALTGVNRYTFRSGRQAYQDLLALKAVAGAGPDALVVAPDAAALAAATPVLGIPGVVARVDTPFDAGRLVVLPGRWRAAFWQGLVRSHTEVITFLGDRHSWGSYGTAATGLRFAAYYFDGADNNFASAAMRAFAPGRRTDLGQPEGFVAAQMVVRAMQYGPDDVDRMIAALEGFRFSSANGWPLTIRAADHALLQPMFQAWLVAAGRGYNALTAATFDAEVTTPPVR